MWSMECFTAGQTAALHNNIVGENLILKCKTPTRNIQTSLQIAIIITIVYNTILLTKWLKDIQVNCLEWLLQMPLLQSHRNFVNRAGKLWVVQNSIQIWLWYIRSFRRIGRKLQLTILRSLWRGILANTKELYENIWIWRHFSK